VTLARTPDRGSKRIRLLCVGSLLQAFVNATFVLVGTLKIEQRRFQPDKKGYTIYIGHCLVGGEYCLHMPYVTMIFRKWQQLGLGYTMLTWRRMHSVLPTVPGKGSGEGYHQVPAKVLLAMPIGAWKWCRFAKTGFR